MLVIVFVCDSIWSNRKYVFTGDKVGTYFLLWLYWKKVWTPPRYSNMHTQKHTQKRCTFTHTRRIMQTCREMFYKKESARAIHTAAILWVCFVI